MLVIRRKHFLNLCPSGAPDTVQSANKPSPGVAQEYVFFDTEVREDFSEEVVSLLHLFLK